jgi:hypothetical protein
MSSKRLTLEDKKEVVRLYTDEAKTFGELMDQFDLGKGSLSNILKGIPKHGRRRTATAIAPTHANPMLPTSKHRGDITEFAVQLAFMKLGFSVLVPVGDKNRYDLVIETSEGFKKIQCKTAFPHKECPGVFRFNTCSVSAYSPQNYKVTNYVGQADYFAIYLPHCDTVVLMKPEEAGKRGQTLTDPNSPRAATAAKTIPMFLVDTILRRDGVSPAP